MICYICRDNVIIPTELIGFNCFEQNQIHCNTFHRVCFYCGINFLQLNRNNYDRDITKKCLICNETCNPFSLSIDNSLKIDFLQLKQDNNEYNCQFCGDYKNSSLKLLYHIKNECSHFIFKCICGTLTKKNELNLHLASCSHYIYCLSCDNYILKTEYEEHQNSIHYQFKCSYCSNYFSNLINHFSGCLFKPINCNFCNDLVQQLELEAHLINHENTLQKEIEEIKTDIKNKYIQYYTIQRFRIRKFNNFYLIN